MSAVGRTRIGGVSRRCGWANHVRGRTSRSSTACSGSTRATADGLVLPPTSALGQAVDYLLARRAPLLRCVTTPGARLDNSAVENAIRAVKLGAENWLFVGHPDARPRLANLFTLVEDARRAGVDVEAYLTAHLTQPPDHSVRRLGEWLPRAWQRRAHAAQRAVGALGLTA